MYIYPSLLQLFEIIFPFSTLIVSSDMPPQGSLLIGVNSCVTYVYVSFSGYVCVFINCTEFVDSMKSGYPEEVFRRDHND